MVEDLWKQVEERGGVVVDVDKWTQGIIRGLKSQPRLTSKYPIPRVVLKRMFDPLGNIQDRRDLEELESIFDVDDLFTPDENQRDRRHKLYMVLRTAEQLGVKIYRGYKELNDSELVRYIRQLREKVFHHAELVWGLPRPDY